MAQEVLAVLLLRQIEQVAATDPGGCFSQNFSKKLQLLVARDEIVGV